MNSKLRDSLCKGCREKIRNYEREYYKKNQDEKKKYRRGYYLAKEKNYRNTNRILTNEEKKEFKNIVDNLPNLK